MSALVLGSGLIKRTQGESRDEAHDSRVVHTGLGTRIRQTGGEIITSTAACQVAGRPYGRLRSFQEDSMISPSLIEIWNGQGDTHASFGRLLIGRSDDEHVVVLFLQLVVNSPDVGGPEPVVVGQHDVEVCLDGHGGQGQAGEKGGDRLHCLFKAT